MVLLPFFLIPKVEHLPTHIIKTAQLHYLLNTFKSNWLSFSDDVVIAESSANWNQWHDNKVLEEL